VAQRYTRRNSLRYPGYDYARSGAVFVTICTAGRQHLFGHVQGGEMQMTPAGVMVQQTWHRIPERFPDVLLDACIVMPDHLHGIILTGARPDVPTTNASLGDMVRWFKSTTHAHYRKGVLDGGWPPYDRHLWQRDYYDHIIRNDDDLDRVRAYIEANPARWQERVDNETHPTS
jgi:putative transposase